MQKNIYVLLLAILVARSGTALGQPQQQGHMLRVVSYNIRHGEGMDEQINLKRIAEVISRHNPDLVALQEVDKGCKRSGKRDIAKELGNILNMEYRFGKFKDYQGGEYGMAILSRFPIIETISHPLPEGTEPKCALEVKVSMKGSPFPISFVCVHNDWKYESIRLKQVETILKAVEKKDGPTVLAGDFNDERPGSSMKLLEANRWTLLGDEVKNTFPSDDPTIEIDFFAVRGMRVLSVEHDVIDEKVASDHRPIYAAIRFQEVSRSSEQEIASSKK